MLKCYCRCCHLQSCSSSWLLLNSQAFHRERFAAHTTTSRRSTSGIFLQPSFEFRFIKPGSLEIALSRHPLMYCAYKFGSTNSINADDNGYNRRIVQLFYRDDSDHNGGRSLPRWPECRHVTTSAAAQKQSHVLWHEGGREWNATMPLNR